VSLSPKQGKTEYTNAQAANYATRRLPGVLAGLKTCPGGSRFGRLFDSKILNLWTMLANVADAGNGFTVTLNVSTLADELGVHRHTVQRWLRFFQRNHLLEINRQRGGRGVGLRVRMVWVQRGDELANLRRKRAFERGQRLNANPEPVSVLGDTVPQRLLSLSTTLRVDGSPHRGDHVRTPGHARFILWRLRQAVRGTGLNPTQRETILSQLARWVWAKTLTLSQLRRVHTWLTDQAGKSVAFVGRQLIQWLLRGLHGVVSWARTRANTRATRRIVAELERADRAAAAVEDDPAQVAAWTSEVRAALVADGWMPATG